MILINILYNTVVPAVEALAIVYAKALTCFINVDKGPYIYRLSLIFSTIFNLLTTSEPSEKQQFELKTNLLNTPSRSYALASTDV